MMVDEKERILNDARNYAKTHKNCTFNDYEYFKRMLHSAGIYGCEAQLANILNL